MTSRPVGFINAVYALRRGRSFEMKFFVLTFEYADKSGFHICGVTQTYSTAVAWRAASDGQHKVYDLVLDDIKNFTIGHKPWGEQ
jgi:hypothetical protein